MTRLEILARLRDIVDNSNADDALELLAYCDKEYERYYRLHLDYLNQSRLKIPEKEHFKLCIWEVFKERPTDFLPIPEIVRSLNRKFPYRTWSYEQIKTICPELYKQNKLEKQQMRYQDFENPHKIVKGIGYRMVEGARL